MQTAENTIDIKGVIESVFFSSPTFSVGRLLTNDGAEIVFAGKVFVQQEEQVVFLGQWIRHPKYGRQFAVEAMEYDLDLDQEGLAHFLAKHPDIKGIGPAKAKSIAENFSSNFEEVLTKHPEKIIEVAKISASVVRNLASVWKRTRETNHVMAWLSAFGLTHHQVTSLIKKFGNNTLSMLKADPYLLIREIRGFGFKKVDVIARKIGTSKDRPERIRAGLVHSVYESLDQGHCWTEYEDLVHQANQLLIMDTLDSRDRIEQALDILIEERVLACISQDGRFLVSLPDIYQKESDLSRIFTTASLPSVHAERFDDVHGLIKKHAQTLNQDQSDAVQNTLAHRISLLSGGAGSGKTFTIASIVRICEARKLQVMLAAPTGKAAKRLEEVVGCPAQTIHRMLGYDGKTFERDASDTIDTDMLIVDEVSMVDVELAWHFFQAVDLKKTSVLLVGDHNQLPPVGPGNVLRDLIQTRSIPTVILDKVVRQAGVLKENSTAILHGDVRKTSEPESDGKRRWFLSDQFGDVLQAQGFLTTLYEEVLEERLEYDLLRDVQVLTPTHKGPLGAKALNEILQRLVQRKRWKIAVPPVRPGRRPKFLKHDKVIQTRNNYDIDVMNGAVGFILEVGSDGSLKVEFEGRKISIESGSPALGDLQLAYALSIHKSQGSEYPCVIVVMHKAHSFMHHRNLFYTGVTRARRTAIIIGDHWGVRNCAKKRQVDNRRTFLSLLLRDNYSKSRDTLLKRENNCDTAESYESCETSRAVL